LPTHGNREALVLGKLPYNKYSEMARPLQLSERFKSKMDIILLKFHGSFGEYWA
jgi:hypothetical protein